MIGRPDKVKSNGRKAPCSYTTHGRECMLFGTMSPSTGGDAPRFYCAFHFHVVTKDNKLNTFYKFNSWLSEYREMFPVERYSVNYLDDDGYEVTEVGQFHKYEANRLWQMMGNREG